MLQNYTHNQKKAAYAYAYTQQHYPEHVAAAHQQVVDYLGRYDRKRLRIFLGETADPEGKAYFLHTSFHLIADMLADRDKGNCNVTPQNIDYFTRLYLKLPYPVIQCGAA